MTSIINAASGGVTFTGGTTAELAIQAGGSTAAAFNTNGLFFRNRFINGDMRIDQRNAGAAVTHSGSADLYVLDRWVCNSTGTPQFSVQQVTDAPTGFVNSSKLTTTTSGTPAAGDFSYYRQYIEGTNIADLGWGAAGALTITLSFWVKSSLTGTFGGALTNSAGNRCYVFSYVINSANTWEYKTVTISGDTTGTWLTTTGRGITVSWDTGSGSTNKISAGSWGTTVAVGVTGGVNLVATASATWQITGVQFETGSTATPFERRPYGTELMLCQRYLPACTFTTGTSGYSPVGVGMAYGSTAALITIPFRVTARTGPSGVSVSNTGSFSVFDSAANLLTVTSVLANAGSDFAANIVVTVASGLTAGNATPLVINNVNARLLFTGCEL
jgi:hypothetical protein